MHIAISYLAVFLSCVTPEKPEALDPKALDVFILEKWEKREYSASVKGPRDDERVPFGRMVLITAVTKDSIELVDTWEIGGPGSKPATFKSRLVFPRDNLLSARSMETQFLIPLSSETLDHRVSGKRIDGKISLETKPESPRPGRDLPNDFLLPESLIRVAAMLAQNGPRTIAVPVYAESVSLYGYFVGFATRDDVIRRAEIHLGKVTSLKVAGKEIECTPVELRMLEKVVTPAKPDEYEDDKVEMKMVTKTSLWINRDQSVIRFDVGNVRFDLDTKADK